MRYLRNIILLLICMAYSSYANAQEEYLQIVSFESENGAYGVFTSAGFSSKKKGTEENAVKSLFYTLLFHGVEGVNNGEPLVCRQNDTYTNSFFNSTARYASYLVSAESITKAEKVGSNYQNSYMITIRLRQLVNDVRKNTHYEQAMAEKPKKKLPNPTIIVVPYKKEGESYQSILENDYDLRIAVSAVQKGFEQAGIKTVDLQARLDRAKRNAMYEDNAGTADSNDKQLLESSGADVYVIVDMLKDVTTSDARISLIMKAYETASGTIWASKEGWTKRFRTQDTDILCSYAVNDNLPDFLSQIIDNYSRPTRASLQISLSGTSMETINDACSDNGTRVMDMIHNWLDENAYEGEYHLQGVVDEKAIFDYVIIPMQDENGYKMTPDKFISGMRRFLESNGIYSSQRIEGNTIFLILDL